MENQTAIDYLIEQLQAPCRGIPSHIIEQSKQIEKEQRLRDMNMILRWVLKHYETHTDSDAMFCWKNPMGEEFNSIDLVKRYYEEVYKGQ